ncbi:uncharacterized protein BT62DRAFT_480830 [Guyanagaster necrorhizus]|uniref:Uncharacterized protein n=1 Tax=Guyanagaster necrorhizus TaxID=856835 RepID=A0A9P8AN64_9AGAR|nr:uncharacterized protein BT62DRAFT_480830 [Guyanagaster necrorhizus MCA 3950]KAG7441499.1 hypothetical protein BT62DRAFT_480830 [Guyanagaster necrorhizus MCA 3950]
MIRQSKLDSRVGTSVLPIPLNLRSLRLAIRGGNAVGGVPLFMVCSFRIVCTIFALTPLVAANFVVLGTFIKGWILYIAGSLPGCVSRAAPIPDTHPKLSLDSIIFCTCDGVALIIQDVGGGIASAATTLPAANKGGDIILGGIVFQLAVITVYVLCAAEFLV